MNRFNKELRNLYRHEKKQELIRIFICAGMFLLAVILQAKDAIPQWNGVISQMQVILSIYLTVISPQTGYKTAVFMNVLASFLATGAVFLKGDVTVFPGIIIPLCTVITVSVISSFHRRLIKELAESVQRKKELQSLYEKLTANEQVLLEQNSRLKEYNKIMCEHEAELRYQAFFDPLTDLQNRGKFQERLTQAVLEAKLRDRSVAMLMIDLDRFKSVNDAAGHAVGDLVLREVGNRLISCVREKDVAYRIGGDEFTVLLEKFSAQQDVQHIAERILVVMSEPFVIENDKFIIGASIGISVFPVDGEDARTIMKKADDAMYVVKRNGGNGWNFSRSQSNRGESG